MEQIQNKKGISFLQKQLLKGLAKIEHGLIVWDDGGIAEYGDSTSVLRTTVKINRQDFYKKFIWGGSVGGGQSFIDGDWECSDLTALMQIIIANESVLLSMEKGWASFSTWFGMLRSMVLRNHVRRSKQNVLAHYDLGNDFFSLILDKKKQYSSALFAQGETDLDAAQVAKLDRICTELELSPADHLLEIGTGWGGLAVYAAQKYGCRVTTTTISDAQHAYVTEQVRQLGLTDKVTLLKKDYRALTGRYEKLVSVEMIEAVGSRYFDKFFQVCNDLLKPGGKFLLQAITIRDDQFKRYKREVDFIKSHVFPGGCLPSMRVIRNCVAKTNFSLQQAFDMGGSYAVTLRYWLQRLLSQADQIKTLGYDEQFLRLFQYYFCYCEGGFSAGYISVKQILLERS